MPGGVAKKKQGCIHFWKIDRYDVGTCVYCGEVKDFRSLQRKGHLPSYFRVAARRGGAARQGKP